MTKPPFGGSVAPVVIGKPTSIGESCQRMVWIKSNGVKYFLDVVFGRQSFRLACNLGDWHKELWLLSLVAALHHTHLEPDLVIYQ